MQHFKDFVQKHKTNLNHSKLLFSSEWLAYAGRIQRCEGFGYHQDIYTKIEMWSAKSSLSETARAIRSILHSILLSC